MPTPHTAAHGACPDDGTCHHGCIERCFRVDSCSPLSGWGEEWPDDVDARPRRFTVRCADGQVRHEPFRSRGEAWRWAWWEHTCTARHTVEYDHPHLGRSTVTEAGFADR